LSVIFVQALLRPLCPIELGTCLLPPPLSETAFRCANFLFLSHFFILCPRVYTWTRRFYANAPSATTLCLNVIGHLALAGFHRFSVSIPVRLFQPGVRYPNFSQTVSFPSSPYPVIIPVLFYRLDLCFPFFFFT